MTEPGRKAEEKRTKPMGHVWDEDLQELNNPLPKLVAEPVLHHPGVRPSGYLVLYPGLGSFAGALG